MCDRWYWVCVQVLRALHTPSTRTEVWREMKKNSRTHRLELRECWSWTYSTLVLTFFKVIKFAQNSTCLECEKKRSSEKQKVKNLMLFQKTRKRNLWRKYKNFELWVDNFQYFISKHGLLVQRNVVCHLISHFCPENVFVLGVPGLKCFCSPFYFCSQTSRI